MPIDENDAFKSGIRGGFLCVALIFIVAVQILNGSKPKKEKQRTSYQYAAIALGILGYLIILGVGLTTFMRD